MRYLTGTIFLLAFLCTFTRPVQAQPQNVIKTNIISPLLLTGNFAYERALNEHNSLQVGVFVSGLRLSGVKYRGFGFTPEYRFYLMNSQTAPNGFYVAPFFRYRNFEIEDADQPQVGGRLRTYGGGVTAGYQAIFSERFSLDVFLGPSVSSASVRSNDGYTPSLPFGLFSGFGLRAGLTFGLAF